GLARGHERLQADHVHLRLALDVLGDAVEIILGGLHLGSAELLISRASIPIPGWRRRWNEAVRRVYRHRLARQRYPLASRQRLPGMIGDAIEDIVSANPLTVGMRLRGRRVGGRRFFVENKSLAFEVAFDLCA